MNPILEAALFYANHFNYSVIPVGKNKKPIIPWKEFQSRKATTDEIEKWWGDSPDANVGIVTGEISGVYVVDIDSEEAKENISKYIPDSVITPSCNTPRGGQHLYFESEEKFGNATAVIPGVDFRGNGGYVVSPPSSNGDGKPYSWTVKPTDSPLARLPSSFIYILNNALSLYTRKTENLAKEGVSSSVVTFLWPKRDDDIFHVANCLAKGGMKEENATAVINILKEYANVKSVGADHDFTDKDVETKIQSAYGRRERSVVNLSSEIRDYILNDLSSSVVFLSSSVVTVVNVSSRGDLKNVSKILTRMCEEKDPIIERVKDKVGMFRKVNKTFEEIKYWERDKETDFPIILPLGLSKLCRILPGAVIIVAGVKSSGKTTFMLNLIKENMGLRGRTKEDIIYMTTELSKPELTDRLMDFRDLVVDAWRFTALRKTDNWQEVITEDPKIFVLDYLDVTKDFYNIGDEIKKISDKLKNGVAIIGIQKKPGVDLGLGGYRTLDKARLYLSMDWGRIKITDVKAPREKGVREKILRFEIDDRGSNFVKITDWITEEEEKEAFR